MCRWGDSLVSLLTDRDRLYEVVVAGFPEDVVLGVRLVAEQADDVLEREWVGLRLHSGVPGVAARHDHAPRLGDLEPQVPAARPPHPRFRFWPDLAPPALLPSAEPRGLLVGVEDVLPWRAGKDAERAAAVAAGRADLGVVEHAVALLVEERHVDGDAVARTAALVAQDHLRRREVVRAQERPREEVAGCEQGDGQSAGRGGGGYQSLDTPPPDCTHVSCRRQAWRP